MSTGKLHQPGTLPRDVPGKYYQAGGFPSLVLSRWVFYFSAIFMIISTAGSLFGWANMVPILVSEGHFSDLCAVGGGTVINNNNNNNKPTSCKDQDIALNGVFSASAISAFIAPAIIGFIARQLGLRRAAQINAAVFILGGAAAVVLGYHKVPGLLYLAFICFGIASSASLMPLYNLANMFPGSEALALAVLSGSFDIGSVVYLIMAYMYDAGVSFGAIMAAFLGGPILISAIAAIILWRPAPLLPAEKVLTDVPSSADHASVNAVVGDGSKQSAAASDETEQQHTTQPSSDVALEQTQTSSQHEPRSVAIDDVSVQISALATAESTATDAPQTYVTVTPPTERKLVNVHSVDTPVGPVAAFSPENTSRPLLHLSPPSTPAMQPLEVDAGPAPTAASQAKSHNLHDRPLLQQLLSRQFIFYALFFMVNMLRYNYYVGTVDSQLNALGQSDSEYTKIYGIIAPLGFCFQFVVGPLIDKFGVDLAIAIQWVLGMLLCICSSIPSLDLQIFTFIIMAAFRAFHFTNMSVYMAHFFGFQTVAVTIGVVILLGGLLSLLQTPLLVWALASEPADFDPPNLTILAAEAVTVLFPLWLSAGKVRAFVARRFSTVTKIPHAAAIVGIHVETGSHPHDDASHGSSGVAPAANTEKATS